MPDTDEQPEEGFDELDTASRVNFRDYPSSGLVMIAAASSGLGWMLYKWLGRRRKARKAAADKPVQASSPTSRNEQQSADKSA
jgi:hypothetical protein